MDIDKQLEKANRDVEACNREKTVEKSEAQILAEHQSRAISRMAAANGKKVDEQELIKDLTESYSRIFNGEV